MTTPTDSSHTAAISSASPRAADSLLALVAEVHKYAIGDGGPADQSERDAMVEVSRRARGLFERLQAIIDWADFALLNPAEFDGHGVRNLDGPVFDAARGAIAETTGAPPPPATSETGERR